MSKLHDEGFELLENIYCRSDCEQLLDQLESAMATDSDSFHVRKSRGTVFAARNLIDICPAVKQVWQIPSLTSLLKNTLGDRFGLVRVLFFDKPSERSWSLPFHKDMTIAVADNSLPTNQFRKPTHKAGVDHVEAPQELLQQMLTLRIHLDDVTQDNGPLQVIPGSHLTGKAPAALDVEPEKVLCSAGDVLAMRPLISHGSAHSNPEKQMNRRILYLEFCGIEELPDGFKWACFIRSDQMNESRISHP